jgi:chorismate mutase
MNFSFNNLLAVIVICRYLLTEITQNNVSIVFESIQDANETSPSKKNMKCNKDLAEGNSNYYLINNNKYIHIIIIEQKLVESSLEACLRLLSTVCEWYTENREIDKIGLLKAVFTLVRDFADFPFYSLQPLAISSHGPHSPCRSLSKI